MGEIEHALTLYEAIKEAIVVCCEVSGIQQLVAYVVSVDAVDESVCRASLRTALAESLPDYMIPSSYQFLPALPLTANGKVDRKNLPEPTLDGHIRQTYVAPQTALERQVCGIWQDILQLEQVGLDDDFFELGGHSLLALRLIGQIKAQFNVQINLINLFEKGTIKEMTEHIQSHQQFPEGLSHKWQALPIISKRDKPAIFCVPGVGMLPLSFLPLKSALKESFDLHTFEFRGMDGLNAPHATITDVVKCYFDAIKNVVADGPYYLLGHSFGGCIAFELARQLESQGYVVKLVTLDSYMHYRHNNHANHSQDGVKIATELLLKQYGISFNQALTSFDADEIVHFIINEVQQRNADTGMDYSQVIKGVFDTCQTQSIMNSTYIPSGKINTDISLVFATNGGLKNADLLTRVKTKYAELTDADVLTHEAKGDHLNMINADNCEQLAQIIESSFGRK